MSSRASDGRFAPVSLRPILAWLCLLVAWTACHEPSHVEDPERSEERALPLEPATGLAADVSEEDLAPPTGVSRSLQAEGLVEAPADAHETASGVRWIVLEEGMADERPGPRDSVGVDFIAWTGDGALLDSSAGSDAPATFPLNAVAPGLREVVTDMAPGETRRVWLPPEQAAGDCPRRAPQPGEGVVMELTLVEVEPLRSIPAPPDVGGPPPGSERGPDGLAWRTLQPGAGGRHAAPDDEVLVHYTGWTPDGRMFDSTLLRDHPAAVTPERAIPGLAVALLDMEMGERRRVWVPAALAWGDQPTEPGAPAGDVVFDLELVATR